jgi:hypothetical protein
MVTLLSQWVVCYHRLARVNGNNDCAKEDALHSLSTPTVAGVVWWHTLCRWELQACVAAVEK